MNWVSESHHCQGTAKAVRVPEWYLHWYFVYYVTKLIVMRLLLTIMSCWLVLSLNAQDIYGCTSPFAPNYNPAATINDYSCDYDMPQLLADGREIRMALQFAA